MAAKEANRTTAPRATEGNVGAAVHPAFLRVGPWALSVVVAVLFALSFATSYAALRDYAYELQFSRTFAIAFPLVLDAVIVVLAVTLLLERALGTRSLTLAGRPIGARPPTWPLLAFWLYFAASVAGNVGHAPDLVAAQLVAAVPPVSAALTFHLLLRLLSTALRCCVGSQSSTKSEPSTSRLDPRCARRVAMRSSPAQSATAEKWAARSRRGGSRHCSLLGTPRLGSQAKFRTAPMTTTQLIYVLDSSKPTPPASG